MTTRKRKPTNAHGQRIPRKPWARVDPIAHAIAGAAKPTASDLGQINTALQTAATAMRQGKATAHDWSVIAGALMLAIAIEREGVVRGIMAELQTFEPHLQAIHDRAKANGKWQRVTLYPAEITELNAFMNYHTIHQLPHLSRSELEAALIRAQATIKSQGHQSEVVRGDLTKENK